MDKYFDKLIGYVVDLLVWEKGYIHLFKAGVLLIWTALLVSYNAIVFLYDKEVSAYKGRYEIEEVFSRQIDKIDCEKIMGMKAKCFLVKHQISLLESSVDSALKVAKRLNSFGFASMVASLFGFLLRPFLRKKEKILRCSSSY